ncbi:efflux RND transporter permease subunit [Cytophaga sp. FL35]|uniref:efflux RND transporter permease subunit n=1 Tax=Cytophaga sp. FL35 TaxID=1904456 RepID=UPI001653DDD4|nr:efflux RND transporter permease subunit [Cytophaga sp. FL35]MBC7000809.1 efflux RND transporter permease subunit [Cytophaga sp. FL35]
MKKKSGAIDWAFKNATFPIALAACLFIVGIYGLLNMPRNEFPDFTIRQGLIIGSYPGASSEKVEEELTSKVEEFLFAYNEVDKTKTYSYSKDGLMFIYVEVSDKINHNATQQFWNKLKSEVLIFQQMELPREVQGIMVNSDFGSTAAMILGVQSETRPYKDLQRHVEDIEDEFRQIENLAKISHSGGLTEQIAVYVDQDKLASYGITPEAITMSLQNQGAVVASGTLEDDHKERPIYLETTLKTEADIARQAIKTEQNGNIIRVRDVAKVVREYDDADSYLTINGTKGMIITLEMAKKGNIVQFGEEIDERLELILAEMPDDIKITKIANQPEVVDHSISHFMKEFGYALIGVIIVTLILLPIRVASVAAATIPITIAATLALMYFMGIELNTVTLAALIVVLGIVVDDPIVIIDNYVEKLDEGMSIPEAAVSSAKELFPSVFTATLAISATFYPLLFFMEGVASDFISAFPYVIIIALTLSLVISVLLVPFINSLFIKKGLHSHTEEKTEADKKSMLDRLQAFFDKTVNMAMKHYKLTVFSGIGAVIVGVILFGGISQQLFPKVERNQFSIEISLAQGHSLEETAKVVKGLEKRLASDERIEDYTSFIGQSSPRFHTLYAPNLPATTYAQILVTTSSDKTTEEVLRDYDEKYADMYPHAYLRMKQLDMAGTNAPIEVRLYGNDIQQLKKYGDTIINIARATPNTLWSRTDYGDMKEVVIMEVKHDEAARLGLNNRAIGNAIAVNTTGLKATEVWDDKYTVDVKIKSDNQHHQKVSDLRQLSIISPQSRGTVPLRQVADISSEWNQEQIVNRNGLRCLTVRVDITKDAVGNEVLAEMQPHINKINFPEDIRIEYGGEYELQIENNKPMGLSLMLSIALIFLILLWHFKSFMHALLSFITMPLSIFGAALGLILMQYPFGFTSFLGLLALCGIVVRNGIILIDYADELRHEFNYSVKKAAILAAERRMRPIFLTSSAAAVGVIPMIASRSSLWGPLGTVIAFGLMFSMVLTLFVLPVLYWLFFRKEDEEKNINDEATMINGKKNHLTSKAKNIGSLQ